MGNYRYTINPHTGRLQKVLSYDYIQSVINLIDFEEGVPTVGDLPSTGNMENEARFVNDTHHLYIWNGSSWQDQGDVIDITWGALEDKPTSIVGDIDDAVTKRHNHTNKAQLDLITDGDHDVRLDNPHNVTPSQIGVNDKYWLQTFILNTPSQITRAFGQSANGLNPGFDIRLNSLKVQFYSEHNTQSKLRIRVYKWDGVALVNREILNITQSGVTVGYHNTEDNTPDTNHYDVDVSAGDRIWIEVDDGTGASANRVSEITVSVNYELI